jgi:uncharacterized protein YmfQ (DUF2313 family)
MPFSYSFPFSFPDAQGADAYARQLKQLLPRGALWLLESTSTLTKALLGMAEELARVDARGVDLVEESDPRTAYETISDWEEMLALPDDVVTAIPATIEERRIAVTQKYTRIGGQSPQFFIDLAATCGYTVTVSKYAVLRVGCRVDDRVWGDLYANAFRLNVSPPSGTVLPQADFERVIRHAVHAHAQVVFNYL